MNAVKLLKKDIVVLKDYGLKYIVMIALVSFALSISGGPIILFFITPVIASRYLLSGTMNYEERSKGYTGLSLLPITRSDIVSSKYLMILLIFTVSQIAAIALSYGGYLAGVFPEMFIPSPAIIPLSFLVCAISDGTRLPMIFKMGETKSRLYNMLSMILCFAIVFALMTSEIQELLYAFFDSIPIPFIIPGTLLLIGAGILYGSYRISVAIMLKKDF